MDQNQSKNIWLLGMTSGMILFLLMVYILVKQPELLHKIDVSGQLLYQLVSSHDGLTLFFTYITTLGNRHAFILYCILLAGSIIFVQRKKLVWFILMAFVLSVLCNHFVKDIFARTRPELEHLVYASGFSFPSGHAMNSMVFFGLLLYFFYGIAQKKWQKALIVIGFSIVILGIAMSRAAVGVHFVSDIVAGLSLGLCIVCVTLFVYESSEGLFQLK